MATPNITGGELYYLWRVSEVHLPRIADAFYDATRLLAGGKTGGSGETDDDAFRANTPAYPGAYGQMSSAVGTAWDALRDELQRGFAQVGETVLEAQTGIRQATSDYLNTDGGAHKDILKVYLDDPQYHDWNDPESNPPKPGSDQDPGTPALPN